MSVLEWLVMILLTAASWAVQAAASYLEVPHVSEETGLDLFRGEWSASTGEDSLYAYTMWIRPVYDSPGVVRMSISEWDCTSVTERVFIGRVDGRRLDFDSVRPIRPQLGEYLELEHVDEFLYLIPVTPIEAHVGRARDTIVFMKRDLSVRWPTAQPAAAADAATQDR